MKAILVFQNEDKLLSNLELDNGFIEIDINFDVASVLQIEDSIKYSVENSLGVYQDIYLVVNSRNFDLVEMLLILDCDILVDDESNEGVLTYFQSLN